MKKILIACVLLVLVGCTHNPIPDGYQGTLAEISDSAKKFTGSQVDLFYLSQVNGK